MYRKATVTHSSSTSGMERVSSLIAMYIYGKERIIDMDTYTHPCTHALTHTHKHTCAHTQVHTHTQEQDT